MVAEVPIACAGAYKIGKAAGQVQAGMEGLDTALGQQGADRFAKQWLPPISHGAYDAAATVNREGVGGIARSQLEQCQDASGFTSMIDIVFAPKLRLRLSEDADADFSAEHINIASGRWMTRYGGYSTCPVVTMSYTWKGQRVAICTNPQAWLDTDGHEERKDKKLIWNDLGSFKFRVHESVEIRFEVTVCNIGLGGDALGQGHGKLLGYAKKKASGLKRVLEQHGGVLALGLDGISDQPGSLIVYASSHEAPRTPSICSMQSCWSFVSGSSSGSSASIFCGSASADSQGDVPAEADEAHNVFDYQQAFPQRVSSEKSRKHSVCMGDANCMNSGNWSDPYASTNSKEVKVKQPQHYPKREVISRTGQRRA